MSCMINNEEIVFFTDHQVDYKRVKEYVRWGPFDSPRLVISRPVFQVELDAGLNTRYKGAVIGYDDDKDEKAPEITSAIYALFKLFESLRIHVEILKANPDDALVEAIAYNFYDCMSGGCSIFFLAACRYLIERYSVDQAKEVYPSGDKWSTVSDFLKEIEHIPRFELGMLEGIELPGLPAPRVINEE